MLSPYGGGGVEVVLSGGLAALCDDAVVVQWLPCACCLALVDCTCIDFFFFFTRLSYLSLAADFVRVCSYPLFHYRCVLQNDADLADDEKEEKEFITKRKYTVSCRKLPWVMTCTSSER